VLALRRRPLRAARARRGMAARGRPTALARELRGDEGPVSPPRRPPALQRPRLARRTRAAAAAAGRARGGGTRGLYRRIPRARGGRVGGVRPVDDGGDRARVGGRGWAGRRARDAPLRPVSGPGGTPAPRADPEGRAGSRPRDPAASRIPEAPPFVKRLMRRLT